MSNPKVFEFAKEVGMTPLALMDKIREWQLPVRSHMAELEPEVLDLIRSRLKGPTKSAKSTKLAKSTETTDEKKTVKKKVIVGSAVVAKESLTNGAKLASKTVVRRKKTEPELLPIEAAPLITPKESEISTISSNSVSSSSLSSSQVEIEPQEASSILPKEKSSIEIKSTTHIMEKPTEVVAEITTAPAVEEVVVAAPPPRKKEVSIGNSGVSSSTTALPKRNIVGRMDLSRVQAPPSASGGGMGVRGGVPPRGGTRTSGASSLSGGSVGGGFRSGGGVGGPGSGFQTRSKGNIRAGFVQSSSVSMFEIPEVSAEEARKKADKRRNKSGELPVTPKVVEDEVEQHFDPAEFRKREMVFQPKKKKGMLARPALKTQITMPKASKRIVKVNQKMKVTDLAMEMGMKATELIKVLMKNGVMANVNTDLDFDTISLIVGDLGWEAVNAFKTADEIMIESVEDKAVEGEKVSRPPVVTIMGHVDHGKTSLLDVIRNSNVAAGEAGGITQHIGAYQIKTEDGHLITFLDTPGHEAFTAMRARGANVTDIAIIVVAADDGVMPQTAEAISHAKAAGVPMIVAVNKIDKPGANPDKIKQQLTEYEVVPEEWGGSTIFVNVSALKKTGIKELLQQIYLLAEMGELTANPKRSGTGTVIESRLDKGRGPVATILIADGTVSVGQYFVVGTRKGRVRSLMNDKGERVLSAGPGTPVEILGLEDPPLAGDRFDVVRDEKVALDVIAVRKELVVKTVSSNTKVSLEELFSKVKKGDVQELNVVLKADVAGSLEAIQGMFSKLATAEVKVKIIHAGVGGITETDVLLAASAAGIVVGFGVRPDNGAISEAKRQGVEIRTYSIVYELMDDMKKAMAGMLTPDIVEKVMGRAEVRNVFTVPKIGTIAGCFIGDGKIQRSNQARLIREGKIIYEGKISSLKRFKDDAKEVAQGFECGIGIENFNDIKIGDIIEAFIKEEVARELSAPTAEA